MSLRIEVTGVKLNYDVTLKSRYTVVIGCSASGKSFLTDVLVSPERHPGYKTKISDNAYEVIAGALAYRLLLKQDDYRNGQYVFLVDDDDFELTDTYKHFVEECTRSYFVILTRNEYVHGINYGLHDVYEFVHVGNADVLIPAFTYSVEPYVDNNTLVISEDSKSGYTFYVNLFTNNKVVCITDKKGNVSGKDALMSMLNRCSAEYGSILLLVDWCSFGMYLSRLSAFISCVSTVSVYLLDDIDSFEYLLLHTSLVDRKVSTEELLSYMSKESAYEDILASETLGKPYYQKHGGDLKDCYIKPCCTLYKERDVCDAHLSGKDKFVSLLKGTVGEILLTLAGRL